MSTLYLDNAATTKINKEVLDEMIKSLNDYGNTEAKYYCYAEKAKQNVKKARDRISCALGCYSDEVIFTSGATEANNLINVLRAINASTTNFATVSSGSALKAIS